MKRLILILALVMPAQSAPLTVDEKAELRHFIEVIQDAARQTQALLDVALADNGRLRAAANDAAFQIDTANSALAAAGVETAKVQGTLDTRTQERDAALADAALQAKWKWRWFWAFTGLAAAVAIFLFLKLKSIL